jgi:hypothetical protein
MGTHWEHVGNKEKRKKILPPPTQNLKENKLRHIPNMLSLPIGYMKFLFSKLFVPIFGVG